MHQSRRSLPIVVMVVAACAGGCITPDPGPVSRFYQLQPAHPGGFKAADRKVAGICVGPVEIPSYIDHPQIVTRVGDHEIEYNETARWAEPLKKNISWALCENLATALGTRDVYPYTAGAASSSAVSVPVRIIRFELQQGGKALLEATWSVMARGPDGSGQTRHVRLEKVAAAAGLEHEVAAQSELLAQLSETIAEDVLRVMTMMMSREGE